MNQVGGKGASTPRGGLGRLGLGAPIRVQLEVQGPFAAASRIWRDNGGRLVCTVVAKATYELGPGESACIDEPIAIQEEDDHWDDDPQRSVHVPGDLAPFKKAAEVVVVGSAFAPGERVEKSVRARVVVGSVDKTLEAHRPRRFRLDGSIEESPQLARFPLRYEHAAGGPGTDNPAGIDPDRADNLGRRTIPQLLPSMFALGEPGDHVPTVGFGPLSPAWPQRSSTLRPHDRAWLDRPADEALPTGFPARHFQAAPLDQWLDRPFAANERLILEGLHANVPRLVTNLSGLEPLAVVAGSSGEPVSLQGDLLFIDTDRALCTLTFRGQVPVPEGASALRIIVVGMPMGAKLSAESARRILEGKGSSLRPGPASEHAPRHPAAPRAPTRAAPRHDPAPGAEHGEHEDLLETTSVAFPDGLGRSDTLPFAARLSAAERPPHPGSALPFRETQPSAPEGAFAPRAPVLPAPLPPLPPTPPVAPALRSTPPPPPSFRSWNQPLSAAPSPAPEAPAAPPPVPATVLARDAQEPVRPAEREIKGPGHPRLFSALRADSPSPSPPGKSPVGSVRAASDAAAGRERAREAQAERAASPVDPARAAAPRRHSVVDLLHFEPKIVPRLRGLRRFAEALAPAPRPRAPSGIDAVPILEPPDKDRHDVLRVLCCARPLSASELRASLAESLDDLGDFETPLALLAGELRPSFDELEMLRATVAVARPLAGTDKKLLALLTVADEALSASPPLRPESALDFCRQIEQASALPSMPARYLATQVERQLIEQRKLKKRTLFGAARIRAELTLARGGELLVVYVPEQVGASLPLLASFPVMLLGELRPREDLSEPAPEALLALAIGRVLQTRAEG